MTVRLTDYHIEHKCKKGTTTWDDVATGLGLRVTPIGKKVWLLKLIYPGSTNQTRRTLGTYPALSIADARTKANTWYQLVKAGRDPIEVEQEQQEAEQRAREEAKAKAAREAENAFDVVAENYIAGRTNRRAEGDAREIRRTVKKEWTGKPIATITPRDVRVYLGELAKRTPAEALNAWGHAVQIFKYAVHEELIEASPMASLDKKLTLNGAKRNTRKRTLNDDELLAAWRAAVTRGYPEGAWVRWLMLTACRVSEGLGMRWRELHPELRRMLRDEKTTWHKLTDEQRVWTVPPERTGNKSDEERYVPLTGDMLTLLATVPGRDPDEFVFSHTGENQLGNLSKLKHTIDKSMRLTLAKLAKARGEDVSELDPWVLHDLRHTIRTALAMPGIDDVVAEMVIGHGRKGIQRVYDHSKRLPEILDALTKWNAKLAAIVKR